MTATKKAKPYAGTRPDRYKKRLRTAATMGLAPYESPRVSGENETVRLNAVSRTHGGYGVLYGGCIVGPFFLYENAVEACGPLSGSFVVRWADFMKSTAAETSFVTKLAKLVRPLVCAVNGFGKHAAVTWPE